MTHHYRLALYLLLPFFLVSGCQSDIQSEEDADYSFRVSSLISTGMIAQRDVAVPVWGYAPPGTDISVKIGDVSTSTTSDTMGHWRVDLQARAAGGPDRIIISDGNRVITVEDVWFGDVWIASGQSNMAWRVANSDDAESEIASATDHLIRHFKVPLTTADYPEDELAGGDWVAASPDTTGTFSAVGYFFARELRKHSDVPIGILNTSWGGSRIEPWMSAEVLGPETVRALFEEDAANMEASRERIREKLGSFPETDAGLVDGVALWADPSLGTPNWEAIAVPAMWEDEGYEELDGSAWYRLAVELSEDDLIDGPSAIALGQIDDSDISWVNGVEVGRTQNAARTVRKYTVPTGTLHAGTNVVAVRVVDNGGAGGMVRGDDELWLETASGKKQLAGDWAFKFGKPAIPSPRPIQHNPTWLYNKMIHPLLPYPITGFIWYQGESNALGDTAEEDAVEYAELFKTMITSWRNLWHNDDAPFLFVQLANFRQPYDEPTESDWAVLRESQAAALELPNVGQAVIIDIGEANDIHPRNKQDVGLRLSLAARYFADGEDIEYSGPVYRSHHANGNEIVIEFDHADSGLAANGGVLGNVLGGFAVAGEDGVYHWATARISGSSITVTSPEVANPMSVRYAWADNPDRANLYNGAGLPASPFRTE